MSELVCIKAEENLITDFGDKARKNIDFTNTTLHHGRQLKVHHHSSQSNLDMVYKKTKIAYIYTDCAKLIFVAFRSKNNCVSCLWVHRKK